MGRSDFSEHDSGDIVVRSIADTTDPRLRTVLSALVQHLHAFVKEVDLTVPEWEAAIAFLTETGAMSQGLRQEYVLLSDVLGVSMLVETMNNRSDSGATESTVLGPFHMVESPQRELGADIALDGKGEPCLVTGRVRQPNGDPIAHALVDVWQANDDGFYDVQQPGEQPELNLRGLFRCDERGEFWFRTIVPRYYPIPTDGPVGGLLTATGRHPYRPAHIHLLVTAPGYRTLTTHVFEASSPYIDSDAVFGVKTSLVHEFAHVDDAPRAAEYGLPNPFRAVDVELVVLPSDGQG
jgi:protocatechuate 3,4-dioxygenase beta subunit